MRIKSAMLSTMTEIYDEVKKIQLENGKILTNNQFNIYGQCTGFYYATLYKYNHKDNPYYQNKELLNRAITCWDYYITLLNDEGKTHIITFDQSWGYVYEEWNTLHLLNTIELLNEDLEPSKLNEYKSAVELSLEGLTKEVRRQFASEQFKKDLNNHSVANHFLWSVTCVYRYAVLYNKNELQKECDDIMSEVCKYQLPFGAFLEGRSLVVHYSHTTLGALALYSYYCNNKHKAIYESTLKNIEYIINCYYKNTEIIGCFDSRNRDGRRDGFPHIPGAFLDNEIAVKFASENLSGYQKDNSSLINAQQSLGFFTAAFYTVPENAEMKVSNDVKDGIVYIDKLENPIKNYSDEALNTLKIQENGFIIPICILTNKVYNNRWYFERQNLFSVYHKDVDLIVGGGHSQGTPELSCFNVISNGKLDYLHSKGRFINDKKISLTYNDVNCEIEILDISNNCVSVKYSALQLSETDRVIVNIPIPIQYYKSILVNGNNIEIENLKYASDFNISGGEIITDKCKISLDKDYISKFPIFAYDTYKQKQGPDFKNAFMILSAELDYKDSEITLNIKL